jgi:hypothetical protein
MSDNSSAQSASGSKSILWMMVALVCGLVILMGAGMLMASRIISALRVGAASDKAVMRTPLGDFRLERANEVGPGLPIYPHATLVMPGAEAVPAKSINAQSQTQALRTVYHTKDDRDFVVNWYAQHVATEFTRHDPNQEPVPDLLREAGVSGRDVSFFGERNDQVRVVAISSDPTGTTITLSRFNKKSQ